MSRQMLNQYFALFFALIGIFSLTGPALAQTETAPTVRWRYAPEDGAVYGQALSDDGTTLIALLGYGFDPGGAFVALDPATGAVRWQINIPESPSITSPVIAEGVVYAGIGTLVTGRSAVYALNTATGTQLWRTDVSNSSLPATPVDGVTLSGDTLFVNRADGVLIALDAATGAQRWTKELGKPPRGVPWVDGNFVYVSTGFDGATIVAFDTATGDLRWNFDEPENPITGPTGANGILYIPFANGDLAAFDAATGAERWREATGLRANDDPTTPTPGLPLLVDNMLYVPSNGFAGSAIEAIDAQTGTRRWIAPVGDFSASAPALWQGMLLVGSDSGELIAFDPADGSERWRLTIPNDMHLSLDQNESPLATGNWIYLIDDSGGIVGVAV